MLKKNKPKRITVRVVVEQETFDEAQEILKTVKFTIGEVIGMLCHQIVIQRKIPFEIKAKEDREEKK